MSRIELEPQRPYSLAHTVGAFGRFPDECVDCLFESAFRRAFQDASGTVLLQVSQDPTSPASIITIEAIGRTGDPDVSHAITSVRRLLAIDEPIQPVYEAMQSYQRLAWLAERLRGLRRTIDPSPFEGLVSSILAQLISIRGAAVIRSRFVREFSAVIETGGSYYWPFPEPESVSTSSVDHLCNLGMTQVKARAILEVARMSITNELDLAELQQQTDADVIRHLVSIPGVGPWTAEWFLVNVLGRMTIVPSGDLGIRRSTGNWLLEGTLPSPEDVRKIYEPFGELRAYVAYYVLSAERYKLLPQDVS